MNLPAMKTSVLPRIGLRRGVPAALAIVATLAVVASAQAQTTYTWNGGGANNNWSTGNNWVSGTAPTSSLTLTNLEFAGSTRPDTVTNSAFSANKITFNTTADFSISPLVYETLTIGAGGLDNQVAQKQTISTLLSMPDSGTTPIKVASGGEIEIQEMTNKVGAGVIEKTGAGSLILPFEGRVDNFRIQDGTVQTREGYSLDYSFEVNGGVLNSIGEFRSGGPGQNPASYFRQTGGVTNIVGGGMDLATIDIQGGTVNVALAGSQPVFFRGNSTISGGTINYTGPSDNGLLWGPASYGVTSTPVLTISGGVQNFGAGLFNRASGVGSSVLVTGGTSTGFHRTQGLTNTGTGGSSTGGSITFTARANTLSQAAKNSLADLTLTSGTVSIGTVAGGGTAIGSLLNSTNTTLGAGNTLNLDFNQDLTRDLLITSGTLNWGGNVALNLANLGEVANGSSWNFFNDAVLGNTGAFSGNLAGISLTASSIYNGLSFSRSGSLWTSTAASTGQQFTFNETTGVLAVVPEPSSIAAAGMGLAMLGWRRLARRRRAAA